MSITSETTWRIGNASESARRRPPVMASDPVGSSSVAVLPPYPLHSSSNARSGGPMAETKTAKKPRRKKRPEGAPRSRGIAPDALASGSPPAAVARLAEAIEADGGSVLATYRDPRGGNWTPNGNHRLAAMRTLGARSAVAIVVPEPEVAHRILLLNTEKAHNLRERALEVARLAEALAALDDRPEREFATEFEEPALVTLGLCYQQNGRFSGGAYHPILKRCDKFLGSKLPTALETRRGRAEKLLELNELVNEAVKQLKGRGLESPYLKAFVVARINPLRFQRKPTADFDETIDKMLGSARRFDAGRIKADQVARTGGPPAAAEE